MIFVAILFPLFAGAQTSRNAEQNFSYPTETTMTEQRTADSEMSADLSEGNTDIEMMSRWHKGARCGRQSDFKCAQHRVFETCDYDNSHGIYGSCRDIGQREGEVICSCR